MFLVHHPGSNREMERELNYEFVIFRAPACFALLNLHWYSDVQVLGLLCTVDLFPVAVEPPSPEHVTPDIPYKAPSAQPPFSSASSSPSSSSTHSPTDQYHHYSSPNYRFVSDVEIPPTSRSSGSKTPAT